MKQIDALFQQKNPGVTINHVAQPGEPQYYQIIQAAATANQGPDVAMFHPGAREYGFGDILVDLTPYIQDVKSQFTAASIAMVSMDGKVGAPIKLLPMTMQGFGIYYNKAYFKKAGLNPEQAPKTAAQFLAACEKLKAAGIVPVTVGQTYTIDFLLRCLVANAFGPNVAGLKDGSEKYTDPLFSESVEFVKTLVDKGYLEKDGFSRPYFMDGIDKFAAGNGGMFVGLLSDVGNWKSVLRHAGRQQCRLLPHHQLPGQQVQGPAGGPGRGNRLRRHDVVQEPEAGRCLCQVRHHRRRGAHLCQHDRRAVPQHGGGRHRGRPTRPSRPSSSTSRAAWPWTTSRCSTTGTRMTTNRLNDRLFVTGELTTDQYIAEYQKLITK